MASVAEASLLYARANLALDEEREREKTASLMALASNICGQGFADAALVFMGAIENDDER